jgi:hypothetical protein
MLKALEFCISTTGAKVPAGPERFHMGILPRADLKIVAQRRSISFEVKAS